MSMLRFSKYQGTGNDFLLGDNRAGLYQNLSQQLIQKLCDRRFGIGADGLILLENNEHADFSMKYFNANGHPGSFCGNGARCITKFAAALGIITDNCTFSASDGPHRSIIENNGMVSLLMQDVVDIKSQQEHTVVNTGSPHLVLFVDTINKTDVVTIGKSIRYSEAYHQQGINVNFVQRTGDPTSILVRTYERGVENETLSCGTGSVAAAIVSAPALDGPAQITVQTKGGPLIIRFIKEKNHYHSIWLCGPAEAVFETHIEPQKLIA